MERITSIEPQEIEDSGESDDCKPLKRRRVVELKKRTNCGEEGESSSEESDRKVELEGDRGQRQAFSSQV